MAKILKAPAGNYHLDKMILSVNSLIFQHLLTWDPVIIYGIIFAAMTFEGEIFLFTAAFLVSQGFLSLEMTFWTILIGVMIGDFLWYWLGHKINHSNNRLSRWLVKATGRLDDHLLTKPLRTLFISKFIYGFHHLILARAGVLKLKFKEFIKDDFISNLSWIFIVGGLGYLSGASFIFIRRYFKFAEYTLLAGLAIFLLADFFVVKYGLKKKI